MEASPDDELSREGGAHLPIADGCFRGLEHLLGIGNGLIDFVIIMVGGPICLIFVPFWFRAIYLITVGMCRLGDGHPLLPPTIGAIIAWWVACQGLLTGSIGTGMPLVISLLVLLGGPTSITVLGHFEISRLRTRYPDEFPHSAMARCLSRATRPAPRQPGPPPRRPTFRGTRAAIRSGPGAADVTRGLLQSSASSSPASWLPPMPCTIHPAP